VAETFWPWLCPYLRGHGSTITGEHGKLAISYETLLLLVLLLFSRPHYHRKEINGLFGVLLSITSSGIICMIHTMYSQGVKYLDNQEIFQ
jgi:hypothetical protein